jgi:hypothetical protein
MPLLISSLSTSILWYKHPLVCAQPSPLEARFPDIERLQPEAALGCLAAIQPALKQSVVASLERELAA